MRRVIGHYEIVEKLGEGGMGEVYKARDLRLQRTVALKVLASERLSGEGFVERFLREARIASALNHPNIVTIHDVDSAGGVPLISMEYVEGRSLADLIRDGPIPIADALRYAVQFADGIACAHKSGIVHRDLKPSNIMVNAAGVVKILDFGVAKRFAAITGGDESTLETGMTQPGVLLGTLAYMSPEQAAGQSTDARSDIFSAGVVLYELFTGIRPFSGGNPQSLLHKIHFEDPSPPSSIRADLPGGSGAIIAKALQKNPDNRFQNISEFRDELQRLLQDITAPGAKRRSRRGLVTAAVVLIAIVGALGTLLLRWVPDQGNTAAVANIDPASTPAAALSAFEWTRLGSSLLRRFDTPSNVDRAIAAYKRALERDPNYSVAYAGLTGAYITKDSATPDPQWTRLAGESAQRAIEIGPDLAAAHLARGRVLLRTRQLEEANRELISARELDPLNADAHLWSAEYYVVANMPDKAEQAYKEAIRLDPQAWNSYQLYGRFLYRDAKYRQAASAWEEGLRVTPDNALLYRDAGAAYHMLDRYEDAASAFQRALEIQPSAPVYNNLGTARFFQGRYELAVAAFEKAVEINPTFYLYWGNLGDARRWTPDKEKNAKQAYERAIELTEERLASRAGDPELTGSLAVYLAKSGQKNRAARTLAEMERISVRTPGSHFKSAVAYEVLGRREDSLRALKAALSSNYSLKEIKTEPELAQLRTERRYYEMLGTVSSPTK